MAPPASPRRTGSVLEGRYRVDGVLARGGMSVVHRGVDLRLERPVAIKIMDRGLAEDPAFVRRFQREARLAARLAHPGIVAVHDQGHDADGTIFLVLELVEGGTLRDVLREHGRLRPATALTVLEHVVTALQVAHARGLVHRDVKPENVLISGEGAVKVADFGLVGAAWGSGDGPADSGGSGSDELILGTVAYLSPEQVADGHADARSDLYSAGVVLFELLTGTPPHTGDSALSVAYRHVHADVPAPSTRVSGVPRALDRLVLDMTRRDPAARPDDAAAFLAAAREVRVAAEVPFVPVPAPRRRAEVPPPPRPMSGTRHLDRRGAEHGGPDPEPPPEVGPDDDARDEDREDGWDEDFGEDASDDDRGDGAGDDDPGLSPAAARASVEVDDRIERLERRRARARSRRILAAWVLVVLVLTVAAGWTGWNLGLA